MKRHQFIVIGILLGLLSLSVSVGMAQSRSVFWERWDVVIDNVDTTSNRFDVTEIYDIRFTGTFRFGSAVIPLNNLDSIRNVQVYQDGALLSATCSEQTGTYCAQMTSDGLSIVYYFQQPLTNASSSFRIQYTVSGALRSYEGGDQLWWSAIPEEHYGFSIGRSTVVVHMPEGFAPREGIDPVETYGAPTEVDVCFTLANCPVELGSYISRIDGAAVVAQATRQIGGTESLEIRVQYPHDPAGVAPAWQSNFDQQRDFEENVKPLLDVAAIGVALLLAVGGPLVILAIYYNRGRDPQVGPVPEFLSEPPSDLRPAVVGALIDERADVRDVISTIVDLAHRGYLVIEESREGGIFGFGQSSEFTFKRTDKPFDDLRPYEKRMMKRIFGSGMEKQLSDLKNKFYRYMPKLQDDLYDEMVKGGFFSSSPKSTRSVWTGIGTTILILDGVATFGIFQTVEGFSPALICIPAAILITGVLALFVGQFMPAKTRQGAEEAAKWRAFLNYLQNLEKYDQVEAASDKFGEYLPYAVAFGMDRSWTRKFKGLQSVPIPTWYYPTYVGGRYSRGYVAGSPLGRGLPSAGDVMPGELASAGGDFSLENMSGGVSAGLESISDGLSEMVQSASRVLTSQPQSSGSSGSWSSGGRSWSGGGFSGGGFSGGGSRGFG